MSIVPTMSISYYVYCTMSISYYVYCTMSISYYVYCVYVWPAAIHIVNGDLKSNYSLFF